MINRGSLIFLCCIVSLGMWPSGALAGAIMEAADAKNTAGNIKAAALDVAAEERNNAERAAMIAAVAAEESKLVQAEKAYQEAENTAVKMFDEAEAAEEKTKVTTAEARQAAAEAAAAQANAEKALAESNAMQDSANANARVYREQASQTAEAAAAAVANVPEAAAYEAAEAAEVKRVKAYEAADIQIAAEDAKVADSFLMSTKVIAEADAKTAIAESKAAIAEEAVISAVDLRQAALDFKNEVADAKLNVEDARLNLTAAQADLAASNQPVRNMLFFESEANFYSWHNTRGERGYQYIQPVTFVAASDTVQYGLRTAYIVAENETPAASGRVQTWADTALAVARINRKPKYEVRYSLDLNVPTGKAGLSGTQQKAVMDDDLVAQSQFGVGWDYTPGISVSHKLNREDTITVGTSYSFRGRYDPDSDTPGGTVTPGNEWAKFLRYQHLGRQWQFSADLAHTAYAAARLDNSEYFHTGNLWELNLTYVQALSHQQSVMLYYRYKMQRPYTAPDPVLAALLGTDNQYGHYYGATWYKPINDRQTFRVSLDVMTRNGRSYDPVSDVSVGASRVKYTGGLGYDIRFTPHSRLAFDVQQFYMKDKVLLDGLNANYHGRNYLIRYQCDF